MIRARRRFPAASIEANLTPMIDVSFLLIVFFVLVSRISSSEQVPMELASVRAGAAVRPEEEARIIVSVVPGEAGSATGYACGGVIAPATPDGIATLAESLAEAYRRNPRLAVRLRADRATHFSWVEPAMRAATAAARSAGGGALPRLDLVVEEEAGRGP